MLQHDVSNTKDNTMAMHHRATRIQQGLYMYRGWKIEDMQPWGTEGPCWNMTPPGWEEATDSENLLRQCKAFIDQCEESKEN
jgi:hypothetical protein